MYRQLGDPNSQSHKKNLQNVPVRGVTVGEGPFVEYVSLGIDSKNLTLARTIFSNFVSERIFINLFFSRIHK